MIVHQGFKKLLVILRLGCLAAVVLGGVKLGDHDLAADGGILFQRLAVGLNGGVVVDRQVRLHTNRVEQALVIQILAELVDGVKLGAVVFIIIVIAQQAVLGGVLPRGLEGLIDKGLVLIHRDPAGFAGRAHRGGGVVGEGLIDHVKGVELELGELVLQHLEEVFHIAVQALVHDLGADDGAVVLEALAEEPAGRLAVPGDDVAAHGDLVVLAELQNGPRVAVEPDGNGHVVPGGLRGLLIEGVLRLHLVLTGDGVKLLQGQRLGLGLADLVGRQGGADLEIRCKGVLEPDQLRLRLGKRKTGKQAERQAKSQHQRQNTTNTHDSTSFVCTQPPRRAARSMLPV